MRYAQAYAPMRRYEAMRRHFRCIFKTTTEYATGVWWAFYMCIISTKQWSLWDLGGKRKNLGHDPHGNGHGHVRVYAITREITRAA